MQDSQLTYHLLTTFEVAMPGVNLRCLQVDGYQNKEVVTRLEAMQSGGLAKVSVARDKMGRPYGGVVVGLTPSGQELLHAMRSIRRKRSRSCGGAALHNSLP